MQQIAARFPLLRQTEYARDRYMNVTEKESKQERSQKLAKYIYIFVLFCLPDCVITAVPAAGGAVYVVVLR